MNSGLRCTDTMESATHMVVSTPRLIQTTTLSSQPINSVSGFAAVAQRKCSLHFHARSSSPFPRSVSYGTRLMCKASTAVHFTDKFDSTQQEQWQSSRKLVEEIGLSPEEADDILAKSFGWSYSDYWGEEKQATVPNPDTVSSTLSLLQSLGIDLSALAKKFPEVMGLTKEEIQYSLGTLDSTWGIAGKNLKNVLMRNPQVLGYNIDCGGDCAGECTRCWVRF